MSNIVLEVTNSETVVDAEVYEIVVELNGPAGVGIPVGGTTGQVLAKNSNTDYDTEWVDQTGGGGSGTVTSVSVTPANGITGTVTNPTTTPAISLNLGNITPTSVAATGNVTGANLSGTNTGDQDLSGYALTSSLATVATSGSYNDLDDLPTIPTLTSELTNDSGFITGNQNITLSGDVSGSGTTAITATLATVNSNVGTFGSTTLVPVISVDGKGRITGVTTASIAPGGVTSFNTRTGAVTLLSADVTGALGFTPYDAANPAGYTSNLGTVTSVGSGAGLTGGPISSTGTLSLSAGSIASLALADSALQSGDNISELVNDAGYTTNVGTVTNVSGTAPIQVATGTTTPVVSIDAATTSTPGSMSAADKTKLDAISGTNTGDQTITLTDDVTGSGTGSFAATLATVNSSPQTDTFRKVTVNGKGLVTATSAVVAGDITTALGYTPGTGTVTTVSVVSANGVSGSVATATTTPSITLTLGAITPTSVAASGAVSGSNLSGTNTGDQTSVTGNAGTATALQTGRTINGITFDGTANINLLPRVQTVTYSGTPTINWANIDVSRITLTGNAVITNSGADDGQKMILEIIQGGSGSYTVSFTSDTRFGSDITSVTLTTTVGKLDRVGLVYNSTATKYDVVALVKGF